MFKANEKLRCFVKPTRHVSGVFLSRMIETSEASSIKVNPYKFRKPKSSEETPATDDTKPAPETRDTEEAAVEETNPVLEEQAKKLWTMLTQEETPVDKAAASPESDDLKEKSEDRRSGYPC